MAIQNENNRNRSLLVALQQNWEHARFEETQRQYQLFVFMGVFGGILVYISQNIKTWDQAFSQFWLAFLFLSVYVWFIAFNVKKWNLEFQNHIAHIQWLSEELELNQPLSPERENDLSEYFKKSNMDEVEDMLKALKEDSMYQGYMGLPLPLPRRVGQNFEVFIDFILGACIFVTIVGLLLASRIFSSAQVTLMNRIFQLEHFIPLTIGIMCGIVIVLLNQRIKEQMKTNAEMILDVRKPNDLNLRYRGYEPFYNLDEKKKFTFKKKKKS